MTSLAEETIEALPLEVSTIWLIVRALVVERINVVVLKEHPVTVSVFAEITDAVVVPSKLV